MRTLNLVGTTVIVDSYAISCVNVCDLVGLRGLAPRFQRAFQAPRPKSKCRASSSKCGTALEREVHVHAEDMRSPHMTSAMPMPKCWQRRASSRLSITR